MSGTGFIATLSGSSPSVVVLNKYNQMDGNWNDANVKSILLNGDLTDIITSISLPNIRSLTIHNNRGA